MKIKKDNLFKKIGRQNILMKPLSVVTTVAAPISYLLFQSNTLVEEVISEDLVAVNAGLISGLQGSILLIVVMLSILQTYKPPKAVMISLIVGGAMMFMSQLFATLGITFVLYGVGYLINAATVDKLIVRNDLLKEKRTEKEIERLI